MPFGKREVCFIREAVPRYLCALRGLACGQLVCVDEVLHLIHHLSQAVVIRL